MHFSKILMSTLMLSLFWSQVSLAETAIIIGNERYRHIKPPKNTNTVLRTVQAIEKAGYNVKVLRDGTLKRMKAILSSAARNVSPNERLIIILSGHVMTAHGRSFLLPIGAKKITSNTISKVSLDINETLAMAQNHAGGAVIFVAVNQTRLRTNRNDRKLSYGLGNLNVPQGVLVVSGPPLNITRALNTQFLVKGRSTHAALLNSPKLKGQGYISRFSTIVPDQSLDISEPSHLEKIYWDVAKNNNSIESYESFLARFPNGFFASEARDAIKVIKDATPLYSREEQAERDMAMTRNIKISVQRYLTLLGFDTYGVDGIFGPATRRAIRKWQAFADHPQSGFLSGPQFNQLQNQAEARAARLEEETRRRAQEERIAEIKFWQQTGQRGSEADLRVYLHEYPDGIYSDRARQALKEIEEERLQTVRGRESKLWLAASEEDTIDAYGAYLREYPDGYFAQSAEARIEELAEIERNSKTIIAAKQVEDNLGLGRAIWLIVEKRLDILDLNPGSVDGRPTDETRRAIRNYQKNSGLPVTGYLDRQTLSRVATFRIKL